MAIDSLQELPALPDTTAREEWRPIRGCRGVYEVSNLGRVRSVDRVVGKRHWKGRVLKTAPNSKGYRCIQLYRDGGQIWCSVHVLAYEAFFGPVPAGLEVCHENGRRDDNRVGNLRVDTPKGNNADKLRHGTAQRGERHGGHRVTAEAVRAMRAEAAAGATAAELARKRRISHTQAAAIIKRKSWGWLDSGSPAPGGSAPAAQPFSHEQEALMLVLTRQVEQRIVIDFSSVTDEEMAALRAGWRIIEIVPVEVRTNGGIRIGTDAPPSVQVHRREIYDEIRSGELVPLNDAMGSGVAALRAIRQARAGRRGGRR